MKKVLFCLFLLLLIYPAAEIMGAEAVTFTADVDKRVLARSDQVVLTLKISGAQPSGKPRLPHLEGLEVASGLLSTSTKMEIINGVARSSVEYKYILIPLKSGMLTIPPATIFAGEKTYETKPIEIMVDGKGDSRLRKSSKKKPIFVDLEADKKSAYIDEQVVLTFRLCESGVHPRNFQYSPPPAKGFRMEVLGNPEGEVGSSVIDGKLYNTITIRYALFPYQTGELKVGPAMLRCTVPDARRRRRPRSIFDDFDFSFFPMAAGAPLNLATDALTVKVLPLPSEGRPEGERISVGQYSMEVSVKPGQVKVGDPITVTAVIQGEGNLDTVAAPVIETDSEFKKYEPSSKTEITDRNTSIRGRKIFEEILVPLNENIKEIPKIRFTYLDTKTRKYRTISKGPIPIEVLPAPEEGPVQIVELRPQREGDSIEVLKKDIHFIKLSPGKFTQTGRTIFSRPAFILFNILPAVCFICLLIITRKRERMQSDFAYARRSRACKRAMSSARKCSALIEKSTPKEFFSSAEAALSRYIGDRLNVPQASVSRDETVAHMRSLGIDEQTVSKAERFYRDCELAQYASMEYESSDMKKSLEELNEIIRAIEKK